MSKFLCYSLLQEANDSKFDDMPLGEWTVEDVGDWLEMIGLADLRPQFQGTLFHSLKF